MVKWRKRGIFSHVSDVKIERIVDIVKLSVGLITVRRVKVTGSSAYLSI